MNVNVILYSFLLILTVLSTAGCSATTKNTKPSKFYVSLPLVDTLQYALANKTKRWQLTIGAYEILGSVEVVTADLYPSKTNIERTTFWRFSSDNNEKLIFSEDGVLHLSSISGRPLDYQMTILRNLQQDGADSIDMASGSIVAAQYYRQIKIGGANYATLTCSDWQYLPFSKTQTCKGKLKHTVKINTDTKGQPVRIEQWLPFLNQQLVLQKI